MEVLKRSCEATDKFYFESEPAPMRRFNDGLVRLEPEYRVTRLRCAEMNTQRSGKLLLYAYELLMTEGERPADILNAPMTELRALPEPRARCHDTV